MPLASIFVLVPTSANTLRKSRHTKRELTISRRKPPRARDKLMTIGNRTTTTGVLLMKADKKATEANKTINFIYPYLQNLPSTSAALVSMRWQRFSDALMTNIAAIVIGA